MSDSARPGISSSNSLPSRPPLDIDWTRNAPGPSSSAGAFRGWVAANAPEGEDWDFTVGRFVDGVNKDLAGAFGNLVNRCLAFAASTFGPSVPPGGTIGPAERDLAHKLGQRLAQL